MTGPLEIIAPDTTVRRARITPAMCGPSSLFVGQLGDWTWESVGALTGTDVLDARTDGGWPAYLAFYYFHIRGSATAHLRQLTFGDRVEVVSRVFGFGSESVLTLHRVERTGEAGAPAPPSFSPDEFYENPRPGCLYVENFNRWVTRGGQPGNETLRKASPPGFRHEHLPALPGRYSPRIRYARAREARTFRDPGPDDHCDVLAKDLAVDYPLDVSRDFNGVGLVYFAAYFAILDWALLRLWRELGRSDRQFMDRVILEHQVCYLGNADVGATLTITMSARRSAGDHSELVDSVIRERGTGREIAISTMHLAAGGAA
jgi:probable biosynthetic protein (TIGR04098 family)